MKCTLKISTFLFCSLCAFTPLDAQQWGENNSVWHYYDFDYSSEGYVTVSVTGDTMVNDQNAKVLEKFAELYTRGGNQIIEPDYPLDIMYEENQVVYLWNATVEVFDTLINFASTPGDTWSIASGGSQSHIVHRLVIDTIRYQVLDQSRKALVVRDSSSQFGSAQANDTLVKGIGPLVGYYRPWGRFEQWVDGKTEGDQFRCFEDDQLGFFNPSGKTCTPLQSPLLFAGDSSRWIYDYQNLGASGIVEVESGRVYEEDNGDLFRDLSLRYVLRENDTIKTYEWETLLTLQYNGHSRLTSIVAELDSTSVDTIYNFQAEIDDVWYIDLPTEENAVRCEVIDTGTIFLSGFPAKTWTVKYDADYIGIESSYTDTVVQGIGNLQEFILPWDYFDAQIDGHQGGTLRCFENEEVSYQRLDIEKCGLDLLLSQKIFDTRQLSIYPNPASMAIYLPERLQGDLSYRIYSVSGTVMEGQVDDHQIDVSSLVSGIYFLAILEKGKVFGTARFVKG